MIYCSFFFFFKQKTAYEMRISDWSSDVCSSDLFDPGSKHYRLGTAPSRLFHVDTRLSDWSRWLEDQMLALANEFETCQGLWEIASERAVLIEVADSTLATRLHLSVGQSLTDRHELGRAAGRERVGQYG